jgi:hypothetical protein
MTPSFVRQRALPSGLHRCGGQALTEFIVIALALVPLFLLMPMVAKYQSVTHATEMASRYVAFEAIANNDGMSNYKPPEQLAQEVRRRFYSNSDAPIKTNDEAGDFKANQNLFWVDAQGDALIKNFTDVTVSFGSSHGANHADGKSAASDGDPFNVPLPFKVGEKLGLKTGMYTANVSVKLANLKDIGLSFASTYEEFKNLNLTVSRHTSVIPDTWTARDPAMVETRIRQPLIFPGSLDAVREFDVALQAANLLAELPDLNKPPHMAKLELWRDQVPADRLR